MGLGEQTLQLQRSASHQPAVSQHHDSELQNLVTHKSSAPSTRVDHTNLVAKHDVGTSNRARFCSCDEIVPCLLTNACQWFAPTHHPFLLALRFQIVVSSTLNQLTHFFAIATACSFGTRTPDCGFCVHVEHTPSLEKKQPKKTSSLWNWLD
jgi:hypothetical protein